MRNTARKLRDSYAKVHTGSIINRAPHLYPRPSYIAVPPPPFHLSFTGRAQSSTGTSAIFRGVLRRDQGNDSPVYVKFAEKYCLEAHELLANNKPFPLAPQVHWCGEILSGLTMIIMEALPGTHLEDPDVDAFPLEDIDAAVDLLHKHNFVHGDIRSPNIVVVPPGTDGGRAHAYLIDFDWAGKEGEARYPASLNDEVTWPRPPSMLIGRTVLKSDDKFMLERLREQWRSSDPAKSEIDLAGSEIDLFQQVQQPLDDCDKNVSQAAKRRKVADGSPLEK